MSRPIDQPFMRAMLVVFGVIILAMLGIVGWCVYEGDFWGASGWLVCTGLVALPSRLDPAILWKERQQDRDAQG
jgi:hypothetical protein